MSKDSISAEPRKIIIDLNNSREAASLKKNEIIQQEALKQFKELITQTKKRIPDFKKQLKHDEPIRTIRTHDVITVDGRRGSGKTTFILSAFEFLDKEVKDNICFLDIIDPTLIETREHVFVTIVSLIKRKVDHVYKNSRTENNEEKYKSWCNSLKKLAKGMQLLDGIGQNHLKSDSWMDEHFALEYGIKNAQSGRDLEQAFHKYISESLDFLDQEAFLIAFDDIDTDFSKGWPVLEILRKYLTTPQLITVISGDLKLYSTLVEKKQIKNLGSILKSEDGEQRFRPMIEELVDQYLMKILKPSHRIELRTTGNYEHNDKYNIEVLKTDGKDSFNLSLVLGNICKNVMFIQNRPQKKDAINLILETPTRTIVSLLSSIEDYFTDDWKELNTDSEKAVFALYNIFLHWIHKFNISKSDLEQEDTKKILSTVINTFLKNKLLPQAVPMKAIFSDKGTNFVMLTLGAYISRSMSLKPRGYIDYMIRAALPARAIPDLSSDLFWNTTNIEAARTINSDKKTELYFKHLGVIDGETTLNVARKHISAMWPSKFGVTDKKMAILNGSIQLSRNSEEQKILEYLQQNETTAKNKYISNFYDKIKDLLKSKDSSNFNTPDDLSGKIASWHKYLAMFPISHNRAKDSTFVHFSFYNLLSCVPRLIDSDDIQKDFESISFVKDYFVMQQSASNPKPDTDNSIHDGDKGQDFYEISAMFKNIFLKWIEKSAKLKESNVHTHTVYKAWTRFYYAIKNIPENINKDRNQDQSFAGSILHRWIVIFMNSILVEEASLYSICDIKYNNPITSDKIFIHNIEQVYEARSRPIFELKPFSSSYCTELKLFEWLFSCPIWAYYLNSESSVFQKHKEAMIYNGVIDENTPIEDDLCVRFTGADPASPVNDLTLHDCLNSLAIFGMRPISQKEVAKKGNKSKRKLSIYKRIIKYIEENSEKLLTKWEEEKSQDDSLDVISFIEKYSNEILELDIKYNSADQKEKMSEAFNNYVLSSLDHSNQRDEH